ncbi:LysR family transcriptional regulator [Aquisalimonas sp.]|uniref:LysR family transcriptional regulator n=1 Tax=Aquisalimonas sp. TaxID=1872621 RepID=UPI0025BD478C|nr:LysR family transcriptional regulator [Aquisalimonas sp.]
MNRKLAWDDLRVIGAIAGAGSLAGAGRRLGVSHATVFRRLAAIEERLGVELFERSRAGYKPTVAGEEAAAAAARIAEEVNDIERRVVGRDLRPWGTVCLTTTDTLLVGLLSPIFAAFRQAYPDIDLEVVASSRVADLARREADIAVRPESHPPELLVGRRVGVVAQAIYQRIDGQGAGERSSAAQSEQWIGPHARMGYRLLETWMQAHGHDSHCHFRVDTVLGMQAAVRDGIGRAILPCYIGDPDPRLTRLSDPISELATDLWILIHPDLRNTRRIRAVADFTAESLAQRPRLGGAT